MLDAKVAQITNDLQVFAYHTGCRDMVNHIRGLVSRYSDDFEAFIISFDSLSKRSYDRFDSFEANLDLLVEASNRSPQEEKTRKLL